MRKSLKKQEEIILTIDPSGTGTTGFCLIKKKGDEENFLFFQNKDVSWESHLVFIIEFIKEKKPNIVVFENTNFIRFAMQSTSNLFKLIGAMFALKHIFSYLENNLFNITVSQVKGFKKKLQKEKLEIENLTFKVGRGHGWLFNKERLSLHQLDSLIIYIIWKKEIEKNEDQKKLQKNQ